MIESLVIQTNKPFETNRGNLNSAGEKKRQIEYRDFKNKDFLLDTVNKCQDGDTEAMENVYIVYKSSLFKLAYRFTGDFSLAEDLLQDIFIKIFTNISRGIQQLALPDCSQYMYELCKKKEENKRNPPEGDREYRTL